METTETITPPRSPSNARTVHLDDLTATEARDRLLDALERAGFSVLAEIDLADVLRRRVDRGIEPLFILEVCRPELATRALAVSSDASLLMPCKLAVWKEGRGATVGMLSPRRLGKLLGHEHLARSPRRPRSAWRACWRPSPRTRLERVGGRVRRRERSSGSTMANATS